MVADHVAAAQRGKADRAGPAGAGQTVAAAIGERGQFDAPAARDRGAECQRRARGGIDLVLVVHLEDLDVERVRAERPGDLLGEPEQQVDAEAHVGGPQDRGLPGGRAERLLLRLAEPGRADHVTGAVRSREPGVRDRRGRARELDHDIGGRDQRPGVGGRAQSERLAA
jgi:hypothetical protein